MEALNIKSLRVEMIGGESLNGDSSTVASQIKM
jgi:hypothetical protein